MSALGMHAVAVVGQPSTLRWVVAGRDLPTGRLAGATGRLGALLRDGVVTDVLVEPHGVRVTLREDESWRRVGEDVRLALVEAIESGSLQVGDESDRVLAAVVDDVLAGPDGDYIRSHGGSVQVRGVHDGTVDLEFLGACSNCSAAGATLHERLDSAVRQRFPQLVALQDVDEGKKRTGHFTLWPTVRRPD